MGTGSVFNDVSPSKAPTSTLEIWLLPRYLRVSRVLLSEMEDVHSRSGVSEREERRLLAIASAEEERVRRLSELEVAEREAPEGGRRMRVRELEAPWKRRRRDAMRNFDIARRAGLA